MNKHLKATLTALMLVAALAACGKDNPPETTPPVGTAETTVSTEPTTVTEPAETTAPETAPSAPLPEVKDGTVYTKEAIDMFNGGIFGFTHSLLIPKIDSTAPGAEALNAKMLADQQEKLDALAAGKEENLLYTVNYSASGADGILVINVYEYTGWQFSEGGSTRRFYYYDAAADCELTADEVLARLSFTTETLEKAFRRSNEYAAISAENTERQTFFAESVFGTPLTGTPENGKFYYAVRNCNTELEFLGIDFDETTVTPCYSYALYVVSTVSCPVSRESMQPQHPYYICTLTADNLTAGDVFRITCKDGKITEATVPADAAVQRIAITPNGITVLYDNYAAFDFGTAEFRVNGVKISRGSSSSLADSGSYSVNRYISDYTPLDELATIEFVLSATQE